MIAERGGIGAISKDYYIWELEGNDDGSINLRAIAMMPMRTMGQTSSQTDASHVRSQMIQFFFISALK